MRTATFPSPGNGEIRISLVGLFEIAGKESGISLLATAAVPCDRAGMPNRPPRKIKKPANPAGKADHAAQLEGQRRHEMATRSTLSRFQNRKSEKK